MLQLRLEHETSFNQDRQVVKNYDEGLHPMFCRYLRTKLSLLLRTAQQRLFQWAGQPPKLSISGRSLPGLIHGSFGLRKSSPTNACRSVLLFLQSSRTWPTERQTDWQTDKQRQITLLRL